MNLDSFSVQFSFRLWTMAHKTGALLLYDFVHWSNAAVVGTAAAAATVQRCFCCVCVFFRYFLFGLPFRLSIVVLVKCNQARDHTIFLHKSDSLLFPTLATVFIQIRSISIRAKRFRYLHSQRQTNGAKNINTKTTSTAQLRPSKVKRQRNRKKIMQRKGHYMDIWFDFLSLSFLSAKPALLPIQNGNRRKFIRLLFLNTIHPWHELNTPSKSIGDPLSVCVWVSVCLGFSMFSSLFSIYLLPFLSPPRSPSQWHSFNPLKSANKCWWFELLQLLF